LIQALIVCASPTVFWIGKAPTNSFGAEASDEEGFFAQEGDVHRVYDGAEAKRQALPQRACALHVRVGAPQK